MLKSNPPRSNLEKILEAVSLFILIGSFLYLLINWGNIPEKVPGHYNFAGEPDRWDDKAVLFVLPGVSLFLYILLTAVSFIPHKNKEDNKISPERAHARWQNNRLMLTFLKAEIMAVFSFIGYRSIEVARGVETGLGEGFLPVYLIIIFGTLTFFLLRHRRI